MVRRSHLLRYFCKEIFIFQSHAILKWFEMFIIFYCLLYCHGKSWKHDAPVAVSLKSPNAGAHGLLLKERTEMCIGWECRTNKISPPPPPPPKKKRRRRRSTGKYWVRFGSRSEFRCYLSSLTHSLTVSHSRNIMAASPIIYQAVATIRSRMITCVSGYSPEITKGENLTMHRERMSNS